MTIYVEKTPNSGKYLLLDTDITDDVTLATKTIYQQDLTAIYKGFTSSMIVPATPNNIKALGYFGNLDLATAPSKIYNAKIYIDELLYKSGTITIENVSYKNNKPSLYQFSFSDGQKNLTELVGEDTLDMLAIGDSTANVYYSNQNIKKALQGLQASSAGVNWFVPLVSTQRIFTVSDLSPDTTDNLVYDVTKPLSSENILLNEEVRPAIFIKDILKRIETKYGFSLNIPYYHIPTKTNQLTNLACQLLGGTIANTPVNVGITKDNWDSDTFREERFDITIKRRHTTGPGLFLVDGFKLNYLGYGSGAAHQASFGMEVYLQKSNGSPIDNKAVQSLEIWEVDLIGQKKQKLNYTIKGGAEKGSSFLKVDIGLDVFYPQGSSTPSTLIEPLIAVFASVDNSVGWYKNKFYFDWSASDWNKYISDNIQSTVQQPLNLFSLLPKMKVIDFVKSIYTMFGLKSFTDKDGVVTTINDFWYSPKVINGIYKHGPKKVVNKELSRFADPSTVTKKPNVYYDGYNLKHKTSAYLANINFKNANGIEYGQVKVTQVGKPKSEFLIETEFTVPALAPIAGRLSERILTYYPFGGDAKLNETSIRYIYDTIVDELPLFYYNGVGNLIPGVAYKDNLASSLGHIDKYHIINYLSNNVKADAIIPNYISSLFGTLNTDMPGQKTLYIQGYRDYIEGTLSGDRLIHEINLNLPNRVITDSFNNSQDIVIGEDKFQVLESSISLTTGKTKIIGLNY